MVPAPTIVVGCAHSGTRAVVSLLDALGSFSGPIDNPWLEHTVFLEIHAELMHRKFGRDPWNSPETLAQHIDDLSLVPCARELIARARASLLLPDVQRWHWKNPRSAWFLPTWQSLYPRAQFIHIIRDGRDVASSLYRANNRSEIPSLEHGFLLWEHTVEHILRNLPLGALTIRYEELCGSVQRIANCIEVDDPAAVLRATRVLRIHSGVWRDIGFDPPSRLLDALGYRKRDSAAR